MMHQSTFANAHIATKNVAVIKKFSVQAMWPENIDQELNLMNVWGFGFCSKIAECAVTGEGLPDAGMIVIIRLTESHMRQWYCRTYLEWWRLLLVVMMIVVVIVMMMMTMATIATMMLLNNHNTTKVDQSSHSHFQRVCACKLQRRVPCQSVTKTYCGKVVGDYLVLPNHPKRAVHWNTV
jgi:hypothetical protein